MSRIDRPRRIVENGGAILRHALAILLITSVHHVYGAIIYRTPWRIHAVHVSVATALALVATLWLAKARAGTRLGQVAAWGFVLSALLVPVLLIGGFEGFYNHLVKNVLYFGGASAEWMARLYPPPKYELPNDVFFELTGVLQVLPAVTTALLLRRTLRS
jgi:hypothetical protein